jgi:uncharacterized phage protein (TIGR01671 family)
MRELKFRAWDKEQNRLFNVYGFDEDHVYEKTLDDYTHSIHPRGVCEIMQYTGLKDKNNKEIYEGDRLKKPTEYIEGMPNGARYKIVEWTMPKHYGVGFNIGEINTWKIVGNIYENSELLEKI